MKGYQITISALPGPWSEQSLCGAMDTRFAHLWDDDGCVAAQQACYSCPVIEDCRAWCDSWEGKQRPEMWQGMYAAETPGERGERRRATVRLLRAVEARSGHLALLPDREPTAHQP
jgi:hypothetical protein